MTNLVNYKEFNKYIEPEFVIYGLQSQEIGVLFGQGAVGKGWLLRSFFESKDNIMFTKPLNILYHSIEEGFKTINNKLLDLDLAHKDLDVSFGKILKEDTPNWKNYDLVIIDTYSRWLNGRADENSNSEMSKAYDKLQNIAITSDCAVLVLAHVNKSSISPDVEIDITSLRGAGSLADNARLAISLEKDKDNNLIAKTAKINNAPYLSQNFKRLTNGRLEIVS